MKRLISVILTLTMLLSLIAVVPVQASVDIKTFNLKLLAFKTQKYGHNSIYQDNPKLTGGYTCFGYANELALYIWGSYPTNSMSAKTVNSGWSVTYGGSAVDSLCVGDIVRYHKHSIFITGINGDTIYYCHANSPSGTNKVTYDNTILKSNLKSKVAEQLTSANTDKTGWVAHCTKGISQLIPETPEIHNHSYSYSNDSEHPHSEYKYCSCESKVYTGKKKLISSCQKCYPLGNVLLRREFEKTKRAATFYRNEVSNATSYTLKVYVNGTLHDSYDMSSWKCKVTDLPSGEYYAVLYAENSNTGEKRSGSCEEFTIANSYKVSYNANGGTGAISYDTKIEDVTLSLTDEIPMRTGYVFRGWAASKNATEAQYQPGGSYTKNAKITLYAVWEPEVYTVVFDSNGGEGITATEKVTYGNTIRMPNSIIKRGAYLKGWSTLKNASKADYELNVEYQISQNLTLYAVWGDASWDSEVSDLLQGEGTEEKPYLISTAADLAYLANKVNVQTADPKYEYYKLTDNINLNWKEWVPIGVYDNEFQYFFGSLDGDGYIISDMYITQPNAGYIGLFGKTQNSDIKNITVSGLIENVKSEETKTLIGGLVADAISTKLENCNARYLGLSSLSVGTKVYSCVGGIVGNITGNGSISGCSTENCSINMKSGLYEAGIVAGHSTVDITDTSVISAEDGLFSASPSIYAYRIGGILGRGECELKKCTVNAPFLVNEIATGTSDTQIAGLVGDFTGTASVCSVVFNDGNIKNINGNSYNSSIYANGNGNISVGGIIGYAHEGSKVVDCKYDGQSISGTTSSATASVGGVIGYADAVTNDVLSVGCNSNLNYKDMPKKDGYKATWYTDSEFTMLYEFGNKLTRDITLYAKWEENKNPKPAPPEQIEVSVKGLTVYVSWEAVDGADKYQVVYWDADAENREYKGIDTTATSCSVELPEGKYGFSVQSMNRYGYSGRKEEFLVTVSQTSAVPANISINSSSSTVFMSWDAVYGASKYEVLYWPIGTKDYKQIVTTATSCSVSLPDGEYGFKVQSMNNYGYSGWSEDYVVKVSPIPAFPENVSISTSSSTAFMSWDAVYGADKYQVVYWDADAENREYKGIDTTATSCSVELPAGKYGFSVQSMNRYGYSGRKEEFLVTVSQVSAVPTNISINSNGSTVLMSWNAVYGADKYSVLYWPEGTTDYKEIITTATSCSVSLPDDEYEFKVQSMNKYGFSGWSNNYHAIISTKTYNVTAIKETDVSLIERSFVNVSGTLYAKAPNAHTGGIIGYGNAGTSSAATTDSTIFVADALDSLGTNSVHLGYIIGFNKNNAHSLNKAYYNSDIEAVSVTNTTGTAIATSLIKVESFLETQLGFGKYTAVANISNNNNAVWVLRDGYMPELYYNCLNDITISQNIENGSISVDKTQAVDGEYVTITDFPDKNYVLDKIYVNGEEKERTFVVNGDCEIYVTFAEKIEEYSVKVSANDNATGSLINMDSTEPMLMTVSGDINTSLTANDGEEILVDTTADTDYTVDAIYVNGEEIIGNSFILSDNSIVTMDVTNISTDVVAVTNDAEDVGCYFAVVSGSVEGDSEGICRYIRYWSADDTETIYTTDVEIGSGDYSAVLMDLEASTTYYYQMTEFGEVRTFSTYAEPVDDEFGGEDGEYDDYEDGDDIDTENQPLTSSNYIKTSSGYDFSIECSQILTNEFLCVAIYDQYGRLIDLEFPDIDTGSPYEVSFVTNKKADYAKVFLWDSEENLKPIAGVELLYMAE